MNTSEICEAIERAFSNGTHCKIIRKPLTKNVSFFLNEIVDRNSSTRIARTNFRRTQPVGLVLSVTQRLQNLKRPGPWLGESILVVPNSAQEVEFFMRREIRRWNDEFKQ
jgi:hypothetical protein